MPKIETVFTVKDLTKGAFQETRDGFYQTEEALKKAQATFNKFSLVKFQKSFENNRQAFSLFHTDAEVTAKKMQMLQRQAEGLVRGGMDPTSDAVQSLVSGFKKLQTELADNKFDEFKTEFENSSKAFDMFNTKADSTKKKIQMLRSEMEDMVKSGASPQSEKIQELTTSYNQLNRELLDDKMQTQDKRFREHTEVIKLTGNEVDVIKGKMSFLKTEMNDLVAMGLSPQNKVMQKMSEEYKTLGNQLDLVQKSTTSFTKRMGNLIKSFVSAQLVVFAIRKVFSTIVNTFKEASKAAADYEETMNLFYTTFENVSGGASSAVTDLADRMGYAQSSIMDALGAVGDMAIGFGATDEKALALSKTTTELVIDLMSFKNVEGDLTENVGAFTSGLLGNTRNLRRYGIIVRDANVEANLLRKGLSDLTGEARELAKVEERLNIAIEQSPKALGDMEKTIDSTVNVNRRFSESLKESFEIIGRGINKELTPFKLALVEVMESANKAANEFENLRQKVNTGSATTSDLDIVQAQIERYQRLYDTMRSAPSLGVAGGGTTSAMMGFSFGLAGVLKKLEEYTNLYNEMQVSIERASFDKVWSEFNDAIKSSVNSIDDILFSISELDKELSKDFTSLYSVNDTAALIAGEEFDRIESLKKINDKYDEQAYLLAGQYDSVSEIGILTRELTELSENRKGDESAINGYYDRRIKYLNEARELESFITSQKEAQSRHSEAINAISQLKQTPGAIGLENAGILFEMELVGMSDAESQLARLENDRVARLQQEQSAWEEKVNSINSALDAQNSFVLASQYEYNNAVSTKQTTERIAYLEGIKTKAIKDRDALLREQEAIANGFVDVESSVNMLYDNRILLLEKQAEHQNRILADQKALEASVRATNMDISFRNNTSDAQQKYEETKSFIEENEDRFIDAGYAIASAFDDYLREENPGVLIARAFSGEIKASDALKGIASQGGLGDIAQIATSKDPWEALIKLIYSVVSEFEIFNDVMNAGKTILKSMLEPIMIILKPLLPIIRILASIFGKLGMVLAEVLYPVIQIFATALIGVLTPINLIIDALVWLRDVYAWVGDSLYKFVHNIFHPFNKKEYKEFPNLIEAWNQTMAESAQMIEEIWEPMDQVKDSAEALADALNELESLYKRGAISGSQLETSVYNITGDRPDYAAAGGANFVTKKPTLILAGESGREHVNITPAPIHGESGGNYTINVNGVSGDANQIAKQVVSEIRRMNRLGYAS